MTASDARLAEIQARLNAATPGPWVFGDHQLIAGVMPDKFGLDKCAYCRVGEPSWVGRRSVNGTRMLIHVHERPEPWHPHGIYAARPDGSVNVVNDTAEYGYMTNADAEFIANAPADIAWLLTQLRTARADGWDAAVAAMQYPDGSPVEVIISVNPYRSQEPLSKGTK